MEVMKAVLLLVGSVAFAQQATRPDLTPGATLPVTVSQVCVPGYSKEVRGEHKISRHTKEQVMILYGLDSKAKGYVIDHLISLELGGSNDRHNLQPQTVEEGRVKDRLENLLHRKVCSPNPTMSLVEAQLELSFDWRSAYAKYFHGIRP